jgi:hypothetical protein
MLVAAGIFGFWQGVGEAPMPVGPWPSAATQLKAKKEAAPKWFPSRGARRCVEGIGDIYSMDTPQCSRLAARPSGRKRLTF